MTAMSGHRCGSTYVETPAARPLDVTVIVLPSSAPHCPDHTTREASPASTLDTTCAASPVAVSSGAVPHIAASTKLVATPCQSRGRRSIAWPSRRTETYAADAATVAARRVQAADALALVIRSWSPWTTRT